MNRRNEPLGLFQEETGYSGVAEGRERQDIVREGACGLLGQRGADCWI